MSDLVYLNNVKDIREGKNINKSKMSSDLGISRKTIFNIEQGEYNVSLDMAYRISAYLGLDIKEVFPLIAKKVEGGAAI